MRAQDQAGLKTSGRQDHTTDVEMVKDCLAFIPYSKEDSVIDAGSGKKKVWFDNIDVIDKEEFEIEDGKDYLAQARMTDWTVGNPPYHISWKFTEKALTTSRKGIGWLLNLNNLNSLLTPKRLDFAKSMGFEITQIHILQDRRWFGRYFFVVYEKKKGILTWTNKKYSEVKA